MTAPGFSGDGSNLTNLTPANLSAGTAGINISGTAATALIAADAALLGGIAPATYARRDVANAFAGAQSMNGSLAIGGGAAISSTSRPPTSSRCHP